MIRKNSLSLSFVLFAIFFTNTTFAAGGYIGGGIGKTDYDADNISTFDDPMGFELILGSDLNPNFAFEVSFVNFGEADDGIPPEWHLSATTLAFGGLLKAPISPTAEAFFKVGLHMWDAEITQDGFGQIYEDDGSDLFFGFGAAFSVSPNLKIGARYMNYTADTDIEELDVTMFMVNAIYGF